MLHAYVEAIEYFKDALFPLFCAGCGKEGEIICESCLKKISAEGIYCCPVCHRAGGSGWLCGGCVQQSFLDRHIAVTEFNEAGLIGRLLHAFKYQYIADAREKILNFAEGFIKKNYSLFSHVDAVAPVPLHPRRLAERGFNQADLVAVSFSSLLKIPKADLLSRKKHTRQQAKLNKQERKNNVADAFRFVGSASLTSRKILLVDDVFTTGSTMQECARVLKESGVKRVIGFTVARG